MNSSRNHQSDSELALSVLESYSTLVSSQPLSSRSLDPGIGSSAPTVLDANGTPYPKGSSVGLCDGKPQNTAVNPSGKTKAEERTALCHTDSDSGSSDSCRDCSKDGRTSEETKREKMLETNKFKARERRKRQKLQHEQEQQYILNLTQENKELKSENEALKRELLTCQRLLTEQIQGNTSLFSGAAIMQHQEHRGLNVQSRHNGPPFVGPEIQGHSFRQLMLAPEQSSSGTSAPNICHSFETHHTVNRGATTMSGSPSSTMRFTNHAPRLRGISHNNVLHLPQDIQTGRAKSIATTDSAQLIGSSAGSNEGGAQLMLHPHGPPRSLERRILLDVGEEASSPATGARIGNLPTKKRRRGSANSFAVDR